MTLRQQQSKFAHLVADLIIFAYDRGYELTFGDAYAKGGHVKNSFHYKRLAIDLNLFKNGVYLTKTKDHDELGTHWETLDPDCTWGGRFNDGNHYSFTEHNRD